MFSSHSNNIESSYDGDYDYDSSYELETSYMPQPSIQPPSPLSLSMITESKLTKDDLQHSYTSSPSTSASSRGYGRNRRDYKRRNRNAAYRYGYDEEEDDMCIQSSDEGYDSFDTHARLTRHHTRRARSTSPPPHSPIFPYSLTSLTSSPSLTTPCPPSPSRASHTDIRETEVSLESRATRDIDMHPPNDSPKSSRNENFRRQWLSLSLQVQFGMFRARRRMRGIVGKGVPKC
ncbi:hypothetical protein GYMLUDRAFT_58039 [Collybiopsis luxurians FD-317 M1]|uniref:Uncharacterized protein n=1 Tax=Collybiopsis luxurians FD-317 M1 TaxID=944289 RepID=A0A0D0C3P8_9AGAR|nr:hypothetical protein GYMLUDRAFT_58039 [Collybiopsis luxurians FD-317 M1]